MSSSDRRTFLALTAAALTAGCFRPMLAEGTPAASLMGRIALPPVGDRMSYHLHQSLRDRLGEPKAPAYRLEVRLSTANQGLGIAPDASVTRIVLRAFADYAIYGPGSDAPLFSGRVSSQSAYSSTSSLYATRQTAEDVERRLAIDLGERIARRLFAAADRGEIG